jgi:hypothetical protein
LNDANQSAELLAAAKTNDQIYRAPAGDRPYPRVIIDYLRQQPEAEIVKADIEAYEKFLDKQDADQARRAGEEPPF